MQGEAVANAIASVDNACGCTFDADAMAVAVGAVFAEATSSALAEACAESAPFWLSSLVWECLHARVASQRSVASTRAVLMHVC